MKTLLKVSVIAVLLIVVALTMIGVYLNSMIKAGVEAAGPRITGTPMKLDAVDLSPFSGQARLKGLVVGNPPGFHTENSFKLADAKVKVDPKTALSNKLIIEEILIDGPEITYEGGLSGSNIGKIQQNVAAFGKSVAPKDAAEPKSTKKDPTQKKVQINDFILKNGKVTMSTTMLKGQALTVPLPDIHLRDIGKESGGVTVQKAAAEVFTAINKSVIQAVASSGKLLEKGAEAAGEAAKGLGSEAGKTVEGIKGLFK
jgi:AsmA-like protein